jgi:hypothetical protein
MDYYPTTETLEDTQQLDVKQNTPAPIVAYQSSSDKWQWVTPRNIAIGIGGLMMLSLFVIMSRNAGTSETIKVAPVQDIAPSSQDVNKLILTNSKASLETLKDATDIKIKEITDASINERSQEILIESQKNIINPKSNCYKSDLGTTCYLTAFIGEMQNRYSDAILLRQWHKANNALFDIKAARVALDGIKQPTPFTPAVVSAAILKENETRLNIANQTDNAKASSLTGMYGGNQ